MFKKRRSLAKLSGLVTTATKMVTGFLRRTKVAIFVDETKSGILV